MQDEKWSDLEKDSCPNHYKLKVEATYGACHCPSAINFTQLAFDANDEALVATDTKGFAYYIELSEKPAFRKLGSVGICTFLAFNPTNNNELLVGLSSTNIKILKIGSVRDFCLLAGHTAPPMHVSFYKQYCLTSSSKEVIIWQLKSYCKAHQLRLNLKSVVVRKAAFSSLGLVVSLYQNDIIQSWKFQQFHKDRRLEIPKFGLKNIRDFDFTKNGRAMIVGGVQSKVLIFSTTEWVILKSINLQDTLNGIKQFSFIPSPVDGGANSVVAILASNGTMSFLNLLTESFIEHCCEIPSRVTKISVSTGGLFAAYTAKQGVLNLTFLERIFGKNKRVEKVKKNRSCPRTSDDRIHCLRKSIKDELKLQRLLPILKEFGEYPAKHRVLIWSMITELPGNQKAFASLVNKVPQKTTLELLNAYPVDKSKCWLLKTTINCLIHWCPMLEQSSFLPKLIGPFVEVFRRDPILAFETILYILLNYCQKWFEYHPLPPMNILGIIENVMLEADPKLLSVFCERGVTSTDYAWPLLQSVLSDVLPTEDWLILWDHMLSLRKPYLLLLCTVAYSISYRETIINTLCSAEDLKKFYNTRGHVSVKDILKIAHRLDRDIPHRIHPRRYLKSKVYALPQVGPYPPFLHLEYPKILTDEICISQLKRLKEMQQCLRERRIRAMEISEEKRAHLEGERFLKHVREIRTNELLKCYKQHICEEELHLENAKKETEREWNASSRRPSEEIRLSDLGFDAQGSTTEFDQEKRSRKTRHKNCRKLQEQVQRLEFEVQHLLATLHSKAARKKCKIK